MKLLILFTVLVAAEAASVANKCTVSDWGEWNERRPHDDRTGKSFPSTAPIDGHKSVREHTMKMKQELYDYRMKCQAEGTCPPELQAGQSEGAIPCVNGFIDGSSAGGDPIPCSNINQLSFMNFVDLLSPTAGGNDCWGWTDESTDPKTEIVIMGMTTGTTFVDITDPTAPVAIAYLDSAASSSSWRDMKVVNDWAFIVSEASGHGIQAFDLSRLRTITPGSTVTADYTLGDVGNCHNIISNPAKNKIYAVGCRSGTHCARNGGLYVVDVTDPANPVIPGDGFNCYDGDGYVHDAQCVDYNGPDTAHVGKDICFCYNENTFTIVDMDDPTAIGMLSRTGYAGASYTHQGWLTEDHTVNLLDDEQDEQGGNGELRTYIWDVVDLDAPVLMNTHYHGLTSIDHNQYIVGDYTYQADYMTGLRVLSIDQGAFTLDEVAYFDVFPATDNDAFFGAWSVYPFFASGNIAISSIDYGLYIVKVNDIAVPKSKVERTRYRSIMNAGDGHCPRLSETEWI